MNPHQQFLANQLEAQILQEENKKQEIFTQRREQEIHARDQ